MNDQKRVENERAHLQYLMSLPVNDPERPKLADQVMIRADKLAARARKFLTLSAEYAEREHFARIIAHPPANVYPAWCKPTTQRKPPPFETRGCLPGMESFYEQIRAMGLAR